MYDDLHSTNPAHDWEKLRPVIDAALDQLPATDRDAVLMRFFNNQSFGDIGIRLGVTENAARMRVDRALDKLNGILSAKKITTVSLAAALATDVVAASAPPALAAHVTAQALAVAALGAGGGIAATLFTMTTSSKIIVAASCVLVVLGVGSAVYEGHRLAEARVQVAAAQHQLDVARAASEADKTRVATLEKELASAKLTQAAAATPTSSPAPRSQLHWANPDYARLQLERFRASLPGKYGSLYRALNLSSDQIAAFEAIQVECRQGQIDIWAAAESQGITIGNDSSARTAVARMTSAPLTLCEEKLKALLGEENMKLYTDYNSPLGSNAMEFVPVLAGDLYTAGFPLTMNQGDQLRKAIMDHTKIMKEPMVSDGGKTMYRVFSQTDWEAVNTDAGAFFSDQQRAILKNRAALEAADAQLKRMGATSGK